MINLVSIPKGKIAYSCYGQGACILLIHGFGLDHYIWEDHIPILSREHKVISVHLPGFGGRPFDRLLYFRGHR